MSRITKEQTRAALVATGGDLAAVAARLGVPLDTLRRRVGRDRDLRELVKRPRISKADATEKYPQEFLLALQAVYDSPGMTAARLRADLSKIIDRLQCERLAEDGKTVRRLDLERELAYTAQVVALAERLQAAMDSYADEVIKAAR